MLLIRFRRCCYCGSYACVGYISRDHVVPLCVECSRGLRLSMSDIFYLCSVLNCPEEPNYIVMLKNGDSGMAFLCRWHLMELRNGAAELVVVSKRIEFRDTRMDPWALSELHNSLR